MKACQASRLSPSSAGAAGLLEDAARRLPGHVVEVAGDLHVGATPDVPAHRLDGLHLGVGTADEARTLRSEPAEVDVDVVAVRRVEEVGQHVGELVVQPGGRAPVEGEATPQLGCRRVTPQVVAQARQVASVGAQPRDVDGLPRAVPGRRPAADPAPVGAHLVGHLPDVAPVQGQPLVEARPELLGDVVRGGTGRHLVDVRRGPDAPPRLQGRAVHGLRVDAQLRRRRLAQTRQLREGREAGTARHGIRPSGGDGTHRAEREQAPAGQSALTRPRRVRVGAPGRRLP